VAFFASDDVALAAGGGVFLGDGWLKALGVSPGCALAAEPVTEPFFDPEPLIAGGWAGEGEGAPVKGAELTDFLPVAGEGLASGAFFPSPDGLGALG
jgi:hypothetical protein